jgi:putative membrane protein
MKKRFLLLALPFLFMACNNETKDSVEKADSTNEAKSDSSNTSANPNGANKMLSVDESTASFMTTVADVSMTEVKVGELARDKATNPRVKSFAEMMVRDHSKANDELKSLAGRKNVTLPTNISDEHRKKLDDLQKKTGRDFDRAYMDMMVDGHESAINDFNKQKDNKDADVKDWVNKMLPALQMHLDSAKAVKKILK